MKPIEHFLSSGFARLGMLGACLLAASQVSAVESTLSLRLVPQLTLKGSVGSTNEIQYVDALKDTNTWISLTNVVLKTASVVFYDTNAPASQSRYYRVLYLGGGSTNEPPGTPEDMVWVTPSTFLMGSPETDADRTDFELPQHSVTLTYGYWIGKYEVTQAKYQELTGTNPSYSTDDPQLPVDTVTWRDATNYCALLTAKSRKDGTLPTGYAYRLPTEAEWECAARAGTATRFSYGDDNSYSSIDGYAWSTDNSADVTHKVAQKKANPWGLYDMYGNVAEWCLDWFDLYPADAQTNPAGPAAGTDHVYRGGSWANTPADCRSAARGGLAPDSALSSFGFRVVLAPAN
jgi:formylglycine-generating enzyme required for sulfatase activity